MKIAITGHRPHKLGNDYDLTSPLIMKIKDQIIEFLHNEMVISLEEAQELVLITGMALGIDTLFAKIAIEHEIPFIAAIPFIGQENKWPVRSQQLYHNILEKASSIRIVDREKDVTYYEFMERKLQLQLINELHLQYSVDKMQNRNIWMVDNSDILIAVWDGTSGGTSNCVMYARSKNKYIYIIDPKTLLHEKSI